MGRGVWILDNVSALHQLAAGSAGAAALLQPRAAYRLRYDVMTGPADPQFIAPGAIIDYTLKADANEAVRLEVLDAAGSVIRTFASGPPAGVETTQGMRAPQTRPAGPPALSSKAGAHRFIWDLRHNGVPGARGGGPMVAPGDYRLRLSLGAFSEERSLKVLSDPRLVKDNVTDAMIDEQTKLLLDIRDKVIEARGVLQKLKAARAAALAETTPAGAARVNAIDATIAKLETAGGFYPQPMLIDQFASISRMLGQADQKPGRDAYERFADLVKELEAIKAEAR
jgi:hypothetical protein